VFSRLHYCNALLAGLPRSTTTPLQRIQNAAARLVARFGPYDHVTAILKDRHWLPIEQRIVFKLCVLMYQVHTGLAPSYLRQCVTASADVTSRPRLRSTSSERYESPCTRLKFGERSFSSAPNFLKMWIKMPRFVVFWTTSTMKDEKSAAKFHYIKTVSGEVVAHSISFEWYQHIGRG